MINFRHEATLEQEFSGVASGVSGDDATSRCRVSSVDAYLFGKFVLLFGPGCLLARLGLPKGAFLLSQGHQRLLQVGFPCSKHLLTENPASWERKLRRRKVETNKGFGIKTVATRHFTLSKERLSPPPRKKH